MICLIHHVHLLNDPYTHLLIRPNVRAGSLAPSAISFSSAGRYRGVPKSAESHNLSSVSCVCPGVSSEFYLPETSYLGRFHEAS